MQSCSRSMQIKAITYDAFEQWLYLLIPALPNSYERGSPAPTYLGSAQRETCYCLSTYRQSRSGYPTVAYKCIRSASRGPLASSRSSCSSRPSNFLKKYLYHPNTLLFIKSFGPLFLCTPIFHFLFSFLSYTNKLYYLL